MKRTIYTILGLAPLLLYAQVNLITSGLSSGGGNGINGISLDFAFGQILDTSFNNASISGSEGILQNLNPVSTSTFSLAPEDFKVYPNPTVDLVNITMPCEVEYQINVFDNLGRKLISNQSSACFDQVDLSALTSGLYHLKINQKQNYITYLIVKN